MDRRRFWITLYLVSLWGVYVAATFHAPGLFVTNRPLYIPLILPSVLAGILVRWKGILVSAVLHLTVASILFGQLLWGRELDWNYVFNFAFALAFQSILLIFPWSLLGTGVGAILPRIILILRRRTL